MALLKTKKVRSILGKKGGLRHKPRGMTQKELQNKKLTLNKRTSNLAKLRHGVKKNVGKNSNKKALKEMDPEKKKELLKKKKEEEDEVEDLGADEGLDNDAYYFPQEQFQINEEDDAILKEFNLTLDDKKKKKRKNSYLGETIFENIEEKFQQQQEKEIQESILNDPKIQTVYGDIANILKEYRSGKLPKAFKYIPVMDQWDKVLGLTKPEDWTPHAMRVATKIFSSSLDMYRAQQFYENYLLPAIRKDIKQNHKLHVQYYMALKHAFYKPGAWFKGIIFPLCRSNNCSIREATIISSIIKKLSIPPLHSSAALMILSDMDYSGAVCIFLKVLIEKKYSLPQRTINSLIDHFRRFEDSPGAMPVIWHQNLLSFCKLYSSVMDEMQKEGLKTLVKKKHHHLISSEILKAIDNKTKEEIIKQNINKSFMNASNAGMVEEEKTTNNSNKNILDIE